MEIFGRIVVLWSGIFALSSALPGKIYLGGIFDSGDEELESAFRTGVKRINLDDSLLPGTKMDIVFEKLYSENSFKANQLACDLLKRNMTAIFGPQSRLPNMHVRSMCDNLEVPHIESRWEYPLKRDLLSINLYPNPSVLNSAFITIINTWGWRDFSLVYEEDEAAARIKDFIVEGEKKKWNIKLYQLKGPSSYRDTFWEIKRSSTIKGKESQVVEHRIVLDVSSHNLYNVLKAAQQVGLMTEHEKYLITSLDLHTIPMEDFQFSKTNITGLRLVQQESDAFAELLNDVNSIMVGSHIRTPLTTLKTETALIYDSVKLLALGLKEMDAAKQISLFPSISCNQITKTSSDGTSLINFMKNVEMTGVSGLIKFDAEGYRTMVYLDIMYVMPLGLKKIGTIWPGNNINITDMESKDGDFQYMDLQSKTYKVTTLLAKPYVMLRETAKLQLGNEQYEGYVLDLLDALKEKIRFKYELYIVADNKHGKMEDNGIWNGIVGDVMSEKADLGIADLTITSGRLEAVDFTLPFMQTGISILFKKPTEKVTSLFSFLSPFSGEVWMLVMGAYIFVSLSLFIVGRLSPYEWSNPHPCRQNDQVEENCFSLLNSMWFTIGSLMQQGSDVAPTAMSTRAITSIWYFFCLIMISSYTANLAAFLTVEKLVSPIENVEDLANQEKIKYGCLKDGSTFTFFKSSSLNTYQKMYKFMMKNLDEVIVGSNEDGKKKVEKGNYAFLMESMAIQFITERECNLTQVGGLLDNKAYGIAVKKGNMKLRNWLSTGILQLQEEGKLHTLFERWWKEKKGGGKCTAGASSGSVNELGLGNVGGVFVVMLLGICLSAFVGIVEFLWFQRKLQRESEMSLFKLLMKEIRYAVSCGSSSKPAPKLKNSEKNQSEENNIPGFNTFY